MSEKEEAQYSIYMAGKETSYQAWLEDVLLILVTLYALGASPNSPLKTAALPQHFDDMNSTQPFNMTTLLLCLPLPTSNSFNPDTDTLHSIMLLHHIFSSCIE